MTMKLSKQRKIGPYHHGDLRRDLLRVARDEIARSGAQAVSLTSLARLAGVSQPAPYRHFADRDALLESVAVEGFEEFDKALVDAAAEKVPRVALQAMALAYVAFGELNVELYRLMFASRLVPEAKPDSALMKVADTAFDRLRSTLAAIAPGENIEGMAVLAWAQLHGLVMLKVEGFINQPLAEFIDVPTMLGNRMEQSKSRG